MKYRLSAIALVSAYLVLTTTPGFAAPFHSAVPAPALDIGSAAQQRVPVAGPCVAGAVYDPACDVNHDGDVDIVDIQLISGHWNQTGAWTAGAGWTTTGNAGTAPGANFLGTTDNKALEMKVNSSRALLVQPTAGGSPNIIAGYFSNAVSTGVVGATISGGGGATLPSANHVADNYGVVGGGASNRAGDFNGDPTDARYAVVGGGVGNTATAQGATVSGGDNSDATGSQSAVAGGIQNWASGGRSAVGGGYNNTLSGTNATAGGGALHFVTGENARVGGGSGNSAGGANAVATGGLANEASSASSSVGGGSGNWTFTGQNSTAPGGTNNTASGSYSLAAGSRAKAFSAGAFIWADSQGTDFTSASANTWRVRAGGGSDFRANNASYGLQSDNDGSGQGLESYASTSEGNNWAALFASNSGSSPGLYANSSTGADAAYFADPIFVTGGCTGCTLMLDAVNAGNDILHPGNIVAAVGLEDAMDGAAGAVLRVRLADTAGAVGVVLRRAAVAPHGGGAASVDNQPAHGAILPGDHLVVVVQGVAQVLTSGDQSLAPGQRLTVDDIAGRARAVRDVEPRGFNTPILGIVLDRPDSTTGLAPVLLTASAN